MNTNQIGTGSEVASKPAPEYRFRLEMANGELFSLEGYIKRLLKTQDIAAWRYEPEAFNAWVQKCVADALAQTTAKLWFKPGGVL